MRQGDGEALEAFARKYYEDIFWYCYKPWHFRFVILETAEKIFERKNILEENLTAFE